MTSFSDETSPPIAPPPPPLNFNTLVGNSGSEEYAQGGRAPNGLEILVAIFFFVAAAWLLIAVFYALMALVVLRLRSRGRLDLYDEEFGRFYVFGTRLFIPCGCILRRYVVAFGHDHPNRERRSRSSDYRYISRSERRCAIEKILLGNDIKTSKGTRGPGVDEEIGENTASKSNEAATKFPIKKKPYIATDKVDDAASEPEPSNSSEDPVCSICLGEYGKT